MRQLLITIAAVLLVGCGPRMSIHEAAQAGNIEAVKYHLANGIGVNAKDKYGDSPLHRAAGWGHNEIAALLRKHGGKTGEEPNLLEVKKQLFNCSLKMQ